MVLSGTGIFSTELSNAGVQVPVVQSSLNYMLLCGCLISLLPVLRRDGLSSPLWLYFVWALCDVEANYFVVKAYQYTSITSVMLLDCFAIPVAMLVSRWLLKAQYQIWHIVACLICVCGLALTMISDVVSGRDINPDLRGPAWLGDALVILGATLYGISNVLQEKLLKGGTRRREALGMLGLCGIVISVIQAMVLEREAFLQITWHSSTVANLLGFQMCLFGMYVLTSVFLSFADAAIFNLSMLTSDIYSVIWAWGFQHQRPTWLYGAAFATTLSGLILYYSKPMPTKVGDEFDKPPDAGDRFEAPVLLS